MGNFLMFKQETGYNCEQLERITGYTRQGLDYAFKMLDNGKKPSKKFLMCINVAISKKIQEEESEMKKDNDRHIKKIERLKKVQSNIEKSY